RSSDLTINPTPGESRQEPRPVAPKEAPDGLWLKCDGCETILYRKELQQHAQICPKCGYHFRIGGWERLEQLADEGSFTVWEDHLASVDPLGFPGYPEKVGQAPARTGLSEAVIVGRAARCLGDLRLQLRGRQHGERGGRAADPALRAGGSRAPAGGGGLRRRGRRPDAGRDPLPDADGQDQPGRRPLPPVPDAVHLRSD